MTMRFMMLYKPGRESDAPPTQQELAAMGQLIDQMAKAGVLIATDGLQPSSKGARVRILGDKFTGGLHALRRDGRGLLPESLSPVGLPTTNMGIPAILYCFLFLYFVFAGAGAWSLDAMIARSKGGHPA
jgi:hypothetical protein